MKRYINILALFISSVFCFSCQSEETYVNQQRDITFILSPETKSTQTGSFDVGDDIGVFAVERTNDNQVGSLVNPKYINLQYRYNGISFDAIGSKIQYSGKKYDFYAYSPYDPSYSNINQITHIASSDQKDVPGWLAADFCSAINTTGIASGNVTLDFSHKFATVQLQVDRDVSAVSLLQVQTAGVFNFATNKASATGVKSDIAMYRQSSGSYLATFPAQTLSGTVFKITKSDSKTIDFELPASKVLQEGVNVIYTIDLKAIITVVQTENGTATGGGEFEVGESCTLKATPDGGYKFGGWYENGNMISSDPEYTFIVTGDRTLSPMFQNLTPVETWQYQFSISDWQIYSDWNAGSDNVSITSIKRKYIDGVATAETANVGYRVLPTTSWISASDNSTYLSWTANNSSSSRYGNVYWEQNESGLTDYAQVHQDGKPDDVVTTEVNYEISVDPTSHTFASTGGSKTFTVKLYKVTKTFTNGTLTSTQRIPLPFGWTSTTSGIGFSNSGDTVTAAPNPNTIVRSGTFTASYMGVSASADLYQEGDDESEIIIN